MVFVSTAFVALAGLLAPAIARPTPDSVLPTSTCSFTESPEVAASPSHNVTLASRQTTWNPPSNLVTALNQVWQHQVDTYPMDFRNFGYDQVIANKGKVNYCVRWESSSSVTAADRANIQTALRRSVNKWNDWLKGFDKWPYQTLDVNVVGWAVSSTSKLQGDTSGIQVYTNKDGAGAPECDPACGRFFHQDNNYSGCKAGAARHYDVSLWLTDGFGGGAGGDWGQRMGKEYFMSSINQDSIQILLHEIGHTFALDDFYDWTPSGVTNFIMKAGSSAVITDFDGWMLRDWWRHLKSRYGL